MGDEPLDRIDELLKQAEPWEPPAGFALRVAHAARQEPAGEPAPRRPRRERLYLAGWWRSVLVTAVRERLGSTVWVIGQYLRMFR